MPQSAALCCCRAHRRVRVHAAAIDRRRASNLSAAEIPALRPLVLFSRTELLLLALTAFPVRRRTRPMRPRSPNLAGIGRRLGTEGMPTGCSPSLPKTRCSSRCWGLTRPLADEPGGQRQQPPTVACSQGLRREHLDERGGRCRAFPAPGYRPCGLEHHRRCRAAPACGHATARHVRLGTQKRADRWWGVASQNTEAMPPLPRQ